LTLLTAAVASSFSQQTVAVAAASASEQLLWVYCTAVDGKQLQLLLQFCAFPLPVIVFKQL
jgi:hypothetical protein